MKISGKRRLIACILALVMLTVPKIGTDATSDTRKKLEAAKQEKEATEDQKNAQEENIDSMEEAQEGLQGELNSLNSQLAQVSSRLDEIEGNIISKNEEIAAAQAELEQAKATEERQYLCLKKRIQYSYEKSSNSFLEAILSAKSFGEILNMTEYFSQMASYDQEMLAAYQQAREAVEEKEARLEEEKAQLDEMKASAEAEHERFSGLISQTQGSISAYSDQIASAEAQVEALEAQIAAQNENIEALQKQLEEEIRKSRLAAQSSWRDISEVTFTEDDRYLLANLIYCEAGGEPYAGQVAVGAVVINRVLSSVFPNTVSSVIYQSGQFEPVSTGRLALALAENRATESCYRAADEAMSGVTNVGTCVFFRTPIPGLEGINIGGHVFY
ncbi:MAG TPA: cell wall hydrolase [Candidatus Eisenbergiella merdipullorum]|uniref:Cell wall hydrolase n=1 Tax=Candidatus Eisenbergiella merdipullorum TaxID=2838553 RepID=A0A9D2KYI5_9FIRM|nr:cell wall hydrolase [Candidatus Eisenbergiella merdipullorum]